MSTLSKPPMTSRSSNVYEIVAVCRKSGSNATERVLHHLKDIGADKVIVRSVTTAVYPYLKQGFKVKFLGKGPDKNRLNYIYGDNKYTEYTADSFFEELVKRTTADTADELSKASLQNLQEDMNKKSPNDASKMKMALLALLANIVYTAKESSVTIPEKLTNMLTLNGIEPHIERITTGANSTKPMRDSMRATINEGGFAVTDRMAVEFKRILGPFTRDTDITMIIDKDDITASKKYAIQQVKEISLSKDKSAFTITDTKDNNTTVRVADAVKICKNALTPEFIRFTVNQLQDEITKGKSVLTYYKDNIELVIVKQVIDDDKLDEMSEATSITSTDPVEAQLEATETEADAKNLKKEVRFIIQAVSFQLSSIVQKEQIPGEKSKRSLSLRNFEKKEIAYIHIEGPGTGTRKEGQVLTITKMSQKIQPLHQALLLLYALSKMKPKNYDRLSLPGGEDFELSTERPTQHIRECLSRYNSQFQDARTRCISNGGDGKLKFMCGNSMSL